MKRSHALKLRAMIEKAAASLDDKDASEAVELSQSYPNNGSLINAGTRINWHGALFRSTVDLWATEQNNPDNASNLWEKVMYRDGIRIIPEVITVTTAFAKGERGWWDDDIYESLLDANVYTPAQYPAGWVMV